MTDIVEFLADRLDEEAVAARAATPGPWTWTGEQCYAGESNCGDDHKHNWGHMGPDLDGPGDGDLVLYSSGHDADQITVSRADAEHIARYDPPRVLADVAAKRAILREYRDAVTARDADPTDVSARIAVFTLGQLVLRPLVQQHADHPGFDPAWSITDTGSSS